jgi:hypothetical protein
MAFEPKTLRHYEYELSAMLTAAADQDGEGLMDLENLLRDALNNGIPQAAAEQRKRSGFSWAYYAQILGISRAGAAKRYTVPADAKKDWIRKPKAAKA